MIKPRSDIKMTETENTELSRAKTLVPQYIKANRYEDIHKMITHYERFIKDCDEEIARQEEYAQSELELKMRIMESLKTRTDEYKKNQQHYIEALQYLKSQVDTKYVPEVPESKTELEIIAETFEEKFEGKHAYWNEKPTKGFMEFLAKLDKINLIR